MPTENATLSLEEELVVKRPASLPERYTFEGLLARGGQGAVYAGTDTLTGSPVAIKLLNIADIDGVERLHREVAALRALNIPGVVRILDDGHDRAHAWVVMVRVSGAPFPAGRTDWPSLRPVVIALLETLARVEEAGLLHRDIKPGNVLIDDAGNPVLLDFGLVRGELCGPTLTPARAIIGTPRYMAPEQVLGDRVDQRTDLYALGAMITEALTGHVPLEAGQLSALFEARLRSEPPTLLSARKDLPAEVAAALDSLVARRPEARPASARAALAALCGELRPFTEAERRPVVEEQPTSLLLPRTDGLAARVATGVQRWVDAYIPQGVYGMFEDTRDAVDRVRSWTRCSRGCTLLDRSAPCQASRLRVANLRGG